MDRIFVALDVETTGLDPEADEIIEVAAVKFRGDEVLETFERLVKPRHSLPLKITRLTGITDADLADAPPFPHIAPDLARFVKSYPIVGHSIGFDLRMLAAKGMRLPQQSFDTFEMATLLVPHLPSYTLSSLCARLGVSLTNAHRALADTEATRQVFLQLLGRIEALSLTDISEITRLTASIQWPLRELFSEIERDKAKKVFLETRTPYTGELGAESQALLGALEGRRPGNGSSAEPTPLKPTGDTSPLEPEEVRRFFAPEGAMGRAFPGYEQRPQQVAMSEAVATAFNSGEPLLVEAGTGVGKSMAYLTPAAMFAARRGERVVVSTNTINLQDQLFFKDIPDLQRIMALHQDPDREPASDTDDADSAKPPFTAALLKGRGNYLCLKRYQELRRDGRLSDEEIRTLLKVQLWLPGTSTGDKAELLLMERENTAWGRINVTPDTCIGPRCPHFRECFFFKARRAAEAAHLVVVNHALMLADLAVEANVLPPYDHLVIDEAHNLEEVATDQLGFAIDQARMLLLLDDLFQSGGYQVSAGLFSELPQRLQESGAGQAARDQAATLAQSMGPVITRARDSVYDCFNRLAVFMNQHAELTTYDPRLRLTDRERKQPVWGEIELAWSNLSLQLTAVGDGLGKLEALLADLADAGIEDYDALLLRVQSLRRIITETRINLGHIVLGDSAELITWLVYDRGREMITVHAAPLSVAELLQANLFAQKATTVLASATMSVGHNFDFVQRRIGLEEAEGLQLDSPFNYQQQALVYLPSDMPEPNQRGYQPALEKALIELCAATGGRALVLFTANSALKQTYRAIQEPLEDQGIAVLGQGIDGSRRSLLQRFRESPRTVLLGTTSFWEGVDVVGDALSVLVIAKLPFSVPTDPIYAARSEGFADPFAEYAVPQAILRFKQGFGRLIRSRSDRGIVAVLDRRLLSKKYGQIFLDSLPDTTVRSGPAKNLPALAARFLGNKQPE
ncbi:MAG TPA: helicase C-terminal domain-containing protein [Roseiflexaceae bacterium]|nr:helicase C-terminal domain-containing protein [Roseiflexaceae bacterium]